MLATFFFILYPTLIPIWLVTCPLYSIQMCLCTWSEHTQRTRSLWSISCNLWTFFNLLFNLLELHMNRSSFALRISLHWPCTCMVSWHLESYVFICLNAKWAQVHKNLCSSQTLVNVCLLYLYWFYTQVSVQSDFEAYIWWNCHKGES